MILKALLGRTFSLIHYSVACFFVFILILQGRDANQMGWLTFTFR